MSLVPGQHKLEDLARLIIRNSQNRGDKPTPLQNEALKRMSKRHIVGSGTSTRQIIQFYQPIFDKLFFLESLKGQLRISATGQPTHLVGNYGWVQPDARDAGKANIAVNTLFDDGKMRTLFHIGTVLHEMIHAFLMIYGLPQYLRDPRF
jgi:hypothetical protein